jgi:hypothetical protein
LTKLDLPEIFGSTINQTKNPGLTQKTTQNKTKAKKERRLNTKKHKNYKNLEQNGSNIKK